MKKPVFLKLNHSGFTLIEVIVVMAVITILVGISLPSLSAYARHAEEIDRANHEQLVGKAIHQYYAYEGNPPNLASLTPTDPAAEPSLPVAEDRVLSDVQAAELRDDLKDVTSARLNIDDYTFTYNEKTGACSIAIK